MLSAMSLICAVRVTMRGQLLPLAFLAPDIVRSIVDGTQPAELCAAELIKKTELPIGWSEQKTLLGFV